MTASAPPLTDGSTRQPDPPGGRAAPHHLSRHLLALVRPWRARLLVVAGCVLAAASLELVPPLVVRHVVDSDLTRGRTEGLAGAAGLYLAATAGVAALTAAYAYLAATVAQASLASLRSALFAHLLALPTSYHDTTPLGDSVSRATADVETIDDLFSSSVASLLGELVRLGTVLVAMLVLSRPLTAAAVVVVPPLAAVTAVLRRRVRDAERDTRVAVGALNSQLADDLAGVEVIRAFGRQAGFAERFRLALTGWLRAANQSVLYNSFYAPSLAVLAAAATALLLWLGGQAGAASGLGATVSIGTLTAFVLLFARFFTPLINLGDEWQSVQAALAGAERVFAVLDLPPDRPDRQPQQGASQPTAPPAAFGAALQLRDVTFGYTPGSPVLHNVNVSVQPGQHVALIGRTGAGKSSVLSLLAGLYTPWTGQVQLAGRDPRALDDDQRRRLLGVVPQNITLFPGTVTDNITLGDKELRTAKVRRAAQIAGAEVFISALPEGYATILADSGRGSGVQLSAGQRQLLALARALVTGPAVLLLDEATALVDGTSDAAFRDALRERVLPTGTAVLTVAHRLATAEEADVVLVLDGGRVVEQGPPAQLLAAGGPFAALVDLEQEGWDWSRQDVG